MASENRLVWRSPFEGYHEYLINPQIASIYMALKTVYVEWIDCLKKGYQEELWSIKKANAFNQRQNFDTLNQLIFAAEKEMLRAFIGWTKSGFNFPGVLNQVVCLKEKLIKIEKFIVSVNSLPEQSLTVQEFSEKDLSGRIFSIMVNKVFRTFPEQYRWRDD